MRTINITDNKMTLILLPISALSVRDFEERFYIVEKKLPTIDMVRKATQNKLGRFTKQDLRELCPSLSVSSVEGALRKMVAEGEIQKSG